MWPGAPRRRREYLRGTGLRAFARTPGNRGALALRRTRDGKAEFLLVSLWASEDAVRRFSGESPDRAVFFPGDDGFLVERDEHVDHFRVVHARPRPEPEGWRIVGLR